MTARSGQPRDRHFTRLAAGWRRARSTSAITVHMLHVHSLRVCNIYSFSVLTTVSPDLVPEFSPSKRAPGDRAATLPHTAAPGQRQRERSRPHRRRPHTSTLYLSQALERMWRTSKSAADSTGNRMPEESFAARMLVDAARDGNFAAVTRLLKEQNWPPHVLTRMGHASGCAALPSSLTPSSVAPKPVALPVALRLGIHPDLSRRAPSHRSI